MGLTSYWRCTRGARMQKLACWDLEAADTPAVVTALLPPTCALVYSDPPWNPGNATYWRTHAGLRPCFSYPRFLDAWVAMVALCQERGATHVLTEQSATQGHCQMLHAAIARSTRWSLPFLEDWAVFYGSPGSTSVRRPNRLLHFGAVPLSTDPTGLAGEPMTIRACAGLGLPVGSWVIDPCMGKGMTSRMAHYFDWNCCGTELNPARLAKTLQWLERQAYTIEEVAV